MTEGVYSKVSRRMWSDSGYRTLSKPQPNAQTMWVYLLTGSRCTILPGLLHVGVSGLAEDLGWPIEDTTRCLRELVAAGRAEFDPDAPLIWLPKALNHNMPTSPSVVVSWAAAWKLLPECALRTKAADAIMTRLVYEDETRDLDDDGLAVAFDVVLGRRRQADTNLTVGRPRSDRSSAAGSGWQRPSSKPAATSRKSAKGAKSSSRKGVIHQDLDPEQDPKKNQIQDLNRMCTLGAREAAVSTHTQAAATDQAPTTQRPAPVVTVPTTARSLAVEAAPLSPRAPATVIHSIVATGLTPAPVAMATLSHRGASTASEKAKASTRPAAPPKSRQRAPVSPRSPSPTTPRRQAQAGPVSPASASAYLAADDAIGRELYRAMQRTPVLCVIAAACLEEVPNMLAYVASWISKNVVARKIHDDAAARKLAIGLGQHYTDEQARDGDVWRPPTKAAIGEVLNFLRTKPPEAISSQRIVDMLPSLPKSNPSQAPPPSLVPSLHPPPGFETWAQLTKRLADDGHGYAVGVLDRYEGGATNFTPSVRKVLLDIHAKSVQGNASAGTRSGGSRRGPAGPAVQRADPDGPYGEAAARRHVPTTTLESTDGKAF